MSNTSGQPIPFLFVSSEFHAFDSLLDWFGNFFSPGGVASIIIDKLFGMLAPLVVALLYGGLFFVAVWMLLFSPVMG
jgi:hypothetical protein